MLHKVAVARIPCTFPFYETWRFGTDLHLKFPVQSPLRPYCTRSLAAVKSPRIAFFHVPTNSIPPFLWRHQPYTPHTTLSTIFTQVQDGDLITTCSSILPNIAQPYIPICTAAPPTLRNTHIPILFRKNSKILLGEFPGPQGLLPTIFEFPYSRHITSNFFRRYNLNSRFLPHGTSFHLLLGLVNIFFRSRVHMLVYTEGIGRMTKMSALRAPCEVVWGML